MFIVPLFSVSSFVLPTRAAVGTSSNTPTLVGSLVGVSLCKYRCLHQFKLIIVNIAVIIPGVIMFVGILVLGLLARNYYIEKKDRITEKTCIDTDKDQIWSTNPLYFGMEEVVGDDHERNANEVDIGQELQVLENDMNQPAVQHHEEERLETDSAETNIDRQELEAADTQQLLADSHLELKEVERLKTDFGKTIINKQEEKQKEKQEEKPKEEDIINS